MSGVNGMSAYHKHKEPSKEMIKTWKKNGSLSDYQNKKEKAKKSLDEKEHLEMLNNFFK